MLLIRVFEQHLLRREDCGFQLLSSGEEAVAVGVCAGLSDKDQLLCSGRSIGPALARGLVPARVAAELLGRITGPCAGLGGRGHLSQPDAGFFGAHAVVGGNLSIAAGVALAFQNAGTPGLAACIFGDGACGAGALHETMNIAASWKLPLLLVCNNNGYSVATPQRAALAPAELSRLADGYGIRSSTVDGMDVLEVADAASRLATHVRSGNGPAFLECKSDRFMPHSTATRETRSKIQLEAARLRCPIEQLALSLLGSGALDSASLERLKNEVEQCAIDAFAYADNSEFASLAEALGDAG